MKGKAMNNKLTPTKVNRTDVIHLLITFLGILFGSFVVATYQDRKTVLKVTEEDYNKMLEEGGSHMRETKVGPLLLSASPTKK
jgi:hypothetical protein